MLMTSTTWVTYYKDSQVKEYKLEEYCKNQLLEHKLYPTHKKAEGIHINELNPIYSEMVAMWYVWQHNLKSDYVGFEHYRRRLDLTKSFTEGQCLVWSATNLGQSLYAQYCTWHYKPDMDMVIDILEDTYEKDNVYVKNIKNSRIFYPCCTYYMKWSDFTLMCNYLFDVIKKFSIKLGISGFIDDVLKMWYHRYEEIFKDKSPEFQHYQARAVGYLSERLISAWIAVHLKPVVAGIDRRKVRKPAIG